MAKGIKKIVNVFFLQKKVNLQQQKNKLHVANIKIQIHEKQVTPCTSRPPSQLNIRD